MIWAEVDEGGAVVQLAAGDLPAPPFGVTSRVVEAGQGVLNAPERSFHADGQWVVYGRLVVEVSREHGAGADVDVAVIVDGRAADEPLYVGLGDAGIELPLAGGKAMHKFKALKAGAYEVTAYSRHHGRVSVVLTVTE